MMVKQFIKKFSGIKTLKMPSSAHLILKSIFIPMIENNIFSSVSIMLCFVTSTMLFISLRAQKLNYQKNISYDSSYVKS